MNETKPSGSIVVGGTRALLQRQMLDSMSSVVDSINAINSQLSVVASNILTTLNALQSSLRSIIDQVNNLNTQLTSMSNQLSGLLNQLVYASYIRGLKSITIYIDNTLDQQVKVDIVGNIKPGLDGSAVIGTVTCGPGSVCSQVYSPEYTNWLPYITIRVTCSTPPTKGYVTVVMTRADGVVEKLVDNLEIRDTNPHDASTDPDKIRWTTW